MPSSPASRSFVKTVKRTSPKTYIQFIAVAGRDVDYRLCERYYTLFFRSAPVPGAHPKWQEREKPGREGNLGML